MAFELAKALKPLKLQCRFAKIENLHSKPKTSNLSINEKLSARYHSTQIDSIVMLSNGDIAVSGGPYNFEILIYRNKISSKWSKEG